MLSNYVSLFKRQHKSWSPSKLNDFLHVVRRHNIDADNLEEMFLSLVKRYNMNGLKMMASLWTPNFFFNEKSVAYFCEDFSIQHRMLSDSFIYEAFEVLLDNGLNPHIPCDAEAKSRGCNFLVELAITAGHLKLTKLLIKHGFQQTTKDLIPLIASKSARFNAPEVIAVLDFLVQHGYTFDNTLKNSPHSVLTLANCYESTLSNLLSEFDLMSRIENTNLDQKEMGVIYAELLKRPKYKAMIDLPEFLNECPAFLQPYLLTALAEGL